MQTTRRPRWIDNLSALATSVGLAVGAGLLLPEAASALSPEIGIDCEACHYATAVKMPLCTGVYMGNRLVITAGHCVDNVNPGVSKARFGEDDHDAQYEFIIESCQAHPAGAPDTTPFGEAFWSGPDIAYCILEEAAEEALAAMPIIPPMLPQGCERNWLAEQVYHTNNHALVTAVGQGCSIHQTYVGQDCEDGIKRFAGQQLVRQTSYAGSTTKLELQRDLWGNTDDTGLRDGDSGGPIFVKMPVPDNTLRLVGVISITSGGTAYAEAVPPYLHWIEAASGIDITPNHKYVNGQWVVEYPTALLPRYEHKPSWWGDWHFACAGAPQGYSDTYTEVPFLSCSYTQEVDDLLANDNDNGVEMLNHERTTTLTTVTQVPPLTSALPFLPLEQRFVPVKDLTQDTRQPTTTWYRPQWYFR